MLDDSGLLNSIFKRESKIFIDTCSLLFIGNTIEEHALMLDRFFECIINCKMKYINKTRVIVPLKVYQEVEKHKKDNSKGIISKKAEYTQAVLYRLYKSGDIIIKGEKEDPFADNLFLSLFTKYRLKYNLVLITQDVSLSKDILKLRSADSVAGIKEISVLRFDKNGNITQFGENSNMNKACKKVLNNVRDKNNSCKKKSFRICEQITDIQDTPIHVTFIPGANDFVYCNAGKIQLRNKISSGGEGVVYETETMYVAKIYNARSLTERKVAKLNLMMSKKLSFTGICFPVEALLNDRNEFVGYLMPKASGKELQRSIFIKPLFCKYFPNWKKLDIVILTLTILKKIKYLHDRNIIMGDINPANIMVESPEKVFFVDTDSYQIEDFPCPVGTVNYTAPELQNRKNYDFLRTIGNELFAVATLLFMLMLPGKSPYSQQGGEDQKTNIINMDFSYPFGEYSNRKTPDGAWRFMWSHLPYELKGMFYQTFKKGQPHSTENERYSVDDWIKFFNKYRSLLENNILQDTDPMSGEIFPKRFKNHRNPETGEITEAKKYVRILETRKCDRCGKEFKITDEMVRECKNQGKELPSRCYGCQNIYEKRTCIKCNKTFEITQGEYKFYTQHNLELPKKCPSCKEASKKGEEKKKNKVTMDNTGISSFFSFLKNIGK